MHGCAAFFVSHKLSWLVDIHIYLLRSDQQPFNPLTSKQSHLNPPRCFPMLPILNMVSISLVPR
jgi:hypothetical protein